MKKIIYFFSLIFVLTNIKLSAQITSGLIAYYPFNGNANDESGNGFNGIVNGVSLTQDRFGNLNKAYSFNGSGQYISLPSTINISRDISLCFWIKTANQDPDPYPSGMFIVDRDQCNIYRDWSISMGLSGNLLFNTGSSVDETLASNSIINDDSWKHIVIVRDGDSLKKKIYIDGVLDAISDFNSIPFTNNSLSIYIGAAVCNTNTHDYCNGNVDDIRFYNRALNQTEINQLYSGVSLKLSVIQQGYYNSIANRLYKKDTVKVYLRQSISPYIIVDSMSQIIDSVTFSGVYDFNNSPAGTYYLALKHKNCIETWSNTPINLFSDSTVNYNFTSNITQAYGNNIVQVDASPVRFGIYSGDINQDGIIDAEDLSNVDNDAANFILGYSLSDINGDNFVDASDISRVDNNIGKIAITP